MRPFSAGATPNPNNSAITPASIASSGAISGTTITAINSGSSSAADATTQPGIFSGGASPAAGNLIGVVIEKSGSEEVFLGINKNSTTGEYGSNALYLSTYTATGLWGMGRGNGAGLPNYADIQNDSSGNVIVNRMLKPNTAQTTTNSCVFAQPFAGSAYKEVVIYYVSGASASYTFPVAFTHTPGIVVSSGGPAASVITSLSTTAVTVSGGSTAGFIYLKGF
jgi:hypothetical protein